MSRNRISFDLAERLDKAPAPTVTFALLGRIFSFLKPYTVFLVASFGVIVISAGLGVAPSLLTGAIIDKGLLAGDLALLCQLVLLSLILLVVSSGLGLLESWLSANIAQGVTCDMKNRMYSHLQTMPHRFFTDTKQGEIITRMTEDISGVRSVITQTLASTLRNVSTIVITLVALYRTNWVLATAGVVLLPLFILPTRLAGKRRWAITRQIQQKRDESNQMLNETLSVSGQLLVKLFGREEDENRRYREINGEIRRLTVTETLTGRLFMSTIQIFSSFTPQLIYLLGGLLMLKVSFGPAVTVGEISIIVSLMTRLHRPVDDLLNIHVDITRSLALFERLFAYYDMMPDITDRDGAVEVPRLKGQVTYDRVSFGYRADAPVLKDVSFTVEPGRSYAFVGGSGAGKSTLITLLPRLYDVLGGSISIDGTDIRDMTLASLRRNIGMVSQDTYLFNGTIAENLRYAKPDATREELEEACRKAHIHDFIASLPQGYDTLVGNRGLRLSGGEKQRLSIARVILKDPPILLLDEATSALDSISESYIQAAIKPLLASRTSLVVAHRLSTVVASDKILVVDGGGIAAAGTHSQLLERSPLYKQLFETQFTVPVKEDDHGTTDPSFDGRAA
ncbi:MAG: ABC transporter ATP-binding protein [Clostridia bacterium]|nr:ABC transporter ATP-binding protein [Clostridia bacterium]